MLSISTSPKFCRMVKNSVAEDGRRPLVDRVDSVDQDHTTQYDCAA